LSVLYANSAKFWNLFAELLHQAQAICPSAPNVKAGYKVARPLVAL